MFAPSIKEILVVGISILAFAGFARGQPEDVQCVAALWGGWLGALLWFIILRAEYCNPFKFIVIFIILPGFLLGSSYFVYRMPHELKPLAPKIQQLAEDGVEKDSPQYIALDGQKRELQLALAQDCLWIWLTGTALAALILGPRYGRCVRRFDYSYEDCKRSRGLLGKRPMEVNPRELPPKVDELYRRRASIPSDLPMERRVREPVNK